MTKQEPQEKKEKKHRTSDKRKEDFLALFARESPHIRDSIVKDLPAYNALLGMNGLSFEDYALQVRATELGIPPAQASKLTPSCPYCKTDEAVGRKEEGIFRCRTCNRTFAANYESISSGTKCDALTWMKVLQCILDFAPIAKTCDYCDISETTYYKIRNRLFYSMQMLMDEVKLYGLIEVDNTFARVSYKGMDLRDSEFDEDSIFFDDRFKPRNARTRGGAYSKIDQNANSVCIFTAIDDRGHVLTRFAGVGATSLRLLKSYLPANKFLLQVPKKDDFSLSPKKKGKDPQTKPGAVSLMVADKERAIESYANYLGIKFESHVFRENGVQRRLSTDSHDIQRVNALHHRLKSFLRKTNYVSTKYLPGYLVLFEFIENTGASPEAMNRLFQILATPNLGKPPTFFREMYTVPNYLLEWFDGNNPLKKIPYNKRLAFYLYDHIRRHEEYPDIHITMEQIMHETGYTAPSIRKFYRDLNAAGYREKILRFFGEPTEEEKERAAEEKRPRKNMDASKTINPIVLAIYDEYVQLRKLPDGQRPSLTALLEEKNAQYGTKFKRANMMMKFKYIEEHGIRTERSETERPTIERTKRWEYGQRPNDKVMAVYEDYENIKLSYRERGENPPKSIYIYEILAKKYELSPSTIQGYLGRAWGYNKAKNEIADE